MAAITRHLSPPPSGPRGLMRDGARAGDSLKEHTENNQPQQQFFFPNATKAAHITTNTRRRNGDAVFTCSRVTYHSPAEQMSLPAALAAPEWLPATHN